ncbi:ScbA/BarX family gamma-butyrolactone biosynthesis protein [Streptomyces albidoflavus]
MSADVQQRLPVVDTMNLSTTVARELVHRVAFSEVLLTGCRRTGEHHFALSAQWPRRHSFFASRYGLHDPMLLAETVRQSIPLILHAEYGVPYGYEFGWAAFSFRVCPQGLYETRSPAELELSTVCDDVHMRDGLPVSMTMRTTVWREGEVVGWSESRFWCRSGAVYQRLRGSYADKEAVFAAAPDPTPAAPGALVGRDQALDIVLSPARAPHSWRLRVDTSHPSLFDHPLDHAPGMMCLEAVRQAAQAAQDGTRDVLLTEISVAFDRYIELDTPCWIDIVPRDDQSDLPPDEVTVKATQQGATAFTATAHVTDVVGLRISS